MTWPLGLCPLPIKRGFALLAMVQGCAPAPGPCLRWLKPGETYEATLGTLDPVPEAKSSIPPRSCGVAFDLNDGDSVSFHTIVPETSSPSCDMISASVGGPVPNVSLGEAGDIAGGAFNPNLEADFPHAIVGEACSGKYRLGLNETDGVLRAYRYFQVDTVDECIAAGADVDKDNPWCWDSWRVVVKDSKGAVVATSVD
jgi:hypothetical protein